MYLRERSELREDRAYCCGCNSWSPLRDAVGSFKKRTHPPLEQYITWTGQPSAQLSTLIRFTAFKKTKHTVSRCYSAVYIPWLVASYDMHKGKRSLNSRPPKPQGKNEITSNNRFLLRPNEFSYIHVSATPGALPQRPLAIGLMSPKFKWNCTKMKTPKSMTLESTKNINEKVLIIFFLMKWCWIN